MGQESRSRSGQLALAALGAQVLIVGFNWVVMKDAVHYASPWDFAALRTSLGAVVLLGLMVFRRRPLRPQYPLWAAVIGLLQTTGMFGLVLWALDHGAAGRTSVLLYAMPFWLLMMAWPLLGQRIRGAQLIALPVALIGLLSIVDPLHVGGTLSSSLVAVAAGISWAASAIVAKRLSTTRSVDVLNLTAWQMLFGSLPLVFIALVTHSHPIVWSGHFVGDLLFNIFMATALTQFLWLYVLQKLSVGTAGMSTLVTPVIGVVSSWFILGERPSVQEGVGMGLVIIALGILAAMGVAAGRDQASRRPTPPGSDTVQEPASSSGEEPTRS